MKMLMYLVRNAHGLLFVAMLTSLLSGFSNASLGSGKTTLAKVLVGLYPPHLADRIIKLDAGKITEDRNQ